MSTEEKVFKNWEKKVNALNEIRLELGLNFYSIEKKTGIGRGKLARFFKCVNVPLFDFYLEIEDFLKSELKEHKKSKQ